MNKSGTILPKINPLNHIDRGTALPVFSEFKKKYRNTKAGWMLASFIVVQLLKEIPSNNLESEMLIVNMLEELLLNCSARDLKTRPDRTKIAFNHLENFEDTFQRMLYQELDMDKNDSKKRADKATATIRSEFEKTSSEIEEERENSNLSTSSSFFQKLKKKFSFSFDSSKIADLSAFRSQFYHKEKDSRFDSDVTFDREKPLTSTPVAHRTRARAPMSYVDLSKINTNRTYAPSVKKEETSGSEEE